MWPKCGPNAAQMWPEYEILWPVINPWTFPVARARPELKPQARNPARTMKKVARPSPSLDTIYNLRILRYIEFGYDITMCNVHN